MTWNLRLVKHVDRKSRSAWYAVHEVFYTDSGKPWAMTQKAVRLEGESPEEVHRYLGMIQRDLERTPVLDVRKIKWARLREDVRPDRAKKFKNIKDLLRDLHRS